MADKPYRDPKTTKIEDWEWHPMEQIKQQLSPRRELPEHVMPYAEYMQHMADRTQAGEISPRDLIKAYTITQSSIGRSGLSHATASKTGMKLPNTGGEIRPEGAFSEWLGSPMGQKYLDAAERGEIHPKALEDIRTKFEPFGKYNVQTDAMRYAANELPQQIAQAVAALKGPLGGYRKFSKSIKGIDSAKSGFIGSLLGRGDQPTLDARQVNLHSKSFPTKTFTSMTSRGRGVGGEEAVDRLTARHNELGYSIPHELAPFAQHLIHHDIWDQRASNGPTETTHEDLIRAMRGYSEGGDVNPTVEQMRRAIAQASTSAGMKAPVVANKPLTGLKDFHQSLGDRIQERVGQMKDMMDSTAFKYDVGHHVFTKGSAAKNQAPYKILSRTMVGNQPMRHPAEEGRLPKVMKDAEGKTMRTPYEPGYRIRQEHGDGEYSEYELPEKAIIGHLAAGGQPHYAKGGAEKEAALPLNLPRAPNMSTQDMQAHVDRIARQQTGEHVTSGKPKDTANLAGRSMAEAKRVKNLEYGLSPTRQLPESPEFHGRAGDINVAVPGDQTISDTVLEHINGIPVGSTSEGGARYGLGKLHKPAAEQDFWASGEDPAQNFQNKVDALARMTGENPRIIAHHLAMGRISNNFAMHLADSNLKYMAAHFPEEAGLHAFNRQIEGGYMAQHPKTKAKFRVTFPDFPGVHRPDEAYMAMQKNPLMRKWFNNRAKSSKLTKELGLPSGLDTEYAITEPALRNMEINLTGHGVGEMQPGEKLREGAEHGTYSHGIKGRYVGHAPELAPLDIAFPDASAYIRSKYNPSDFTGTMQKVFPHQVVDPQHLDQMAKYYDMLRKTRGFAEGGSIDEVEPSQDEMLAHVMLHKAVGGAVTPDAPDQPNGESTDLGYYEGGPSDGANVDPMQYLADGGAVKPSDIGVDEAPDMPVKWYMPPGDGTGNKMPIGGVDFQPQTPGQQMAPAQAQPQQGGQLGAAPTGAPQGAGMPQMGQAPQMPPTGGAGAPTGPQSNILNMTRQGQAMSAMRATPPPSPLIKPGVPHMKKGGKVALTTEQMKAALKRKKAAGGEFEPSKISDIGMTERPL